MQDKKILIVSYNVGKTGEDSTDSENIWKQLHAMLSSINRISGVSSDFLPNLKGIARSPSTTQSKRSNGRCKAQASREGAQRFEFSMNDGS